MRRDGVSWFGARHQWWILGLGLVLAVLAAVFKAWGTPLTAVAVGAAVTFLANEGVKAVRESRDRRERERSILRSTTSSSGMDGRGLVTVAEIPAERLGVRSSTLQVPHQRRDAESAVLQRLREGRPVVITGAAMAGKSHVGVHILKEEYAEWPIAVVLPNELPTLLRDGVPSQSVVWLDDLERYLTVEGLRPDWVDFLWDQHNVLLATMRRSERAAFEPLGDVRHPQEGALARFVEVALVEDSAERSRIASSMASPAMRKGVEAYGLGVYLGGGHLIRRRFEDAADRHPLGQAMARTAAEWRRVGLDDIDLNLLLPLARSTQPPHQRFDKTVSESAELAWAGESIAGVLPFFAPSGPNLVRATDFLVDQLAGSPIHDAVWQAALHAQVDDAQALEVSFRAYEHGRFAEAERLWSRLARSEDPQVASVAGFDLGVVAWVNQDAATAIDALERVIATGTEDFAIRARLNLATIKDTLGDWDAAIEGYRRVVRSGVQPQSAKASFNLGVLLSKTGQIAAARDAYRAAATSGVPEESAAANLNLGRLLEASGDIVGAEQAWEQALLSEHPEYAPSALIALAKVAADRGDTAKAHDVLHAVMRDARPSERNRAAFNLAVLHENMGDLNGALRLFGELAESTDVEQAPAALVALGRLAETRGDTRGATTAYERAIEFDHASHSLAARSNLAILWARAGDHERAEKALLEVADASHPQESPRALLNLGVINDADGDTDAAASVWQAAADQSTNPGVASDAALRLGLLHVARKNLALAQPYLHRVANGGPSPNRALAAVNLGVILSSQGDTAGAQKQYRLAQSEGSAQIAEVASQLLQSLDAAD